MVRGAEVGTDIKNPGEYDTQTDIIEVISYSHLGKVTLNSMIGIFGR